ncbi:hypothetical protein ACFVH4_09520 [Nocardia ignorata]|uniref:hypothetical protein n=1 Tax=Nocardia ignorata TaxID=145285 RepID=UPI0036362900
MGTISELENSIRELELTQLGSTTIAAHAVVQVIDPRTLAIVVYRGHDIQIIEDAIHNQHYQIATITSANEIITVTI